MTPAQRADAERIIRALQNLGNEEEEAAALLRELAAEPQGESIGYMPETGIKRLRSGVGPVGVWPGKAAANYTPVYAHPPQRQPLTANEIIALPEWGDYVSGCCTLLDFARAVERAHGIGDSNG